MSITPSVEKRALHWIVGRDTGMSSEALWAKMMGVSGSHSSHPYDPFDLGRCLRLLAFIPEWNDRLAEMKSVSTAWHRLVSNWSILRDSMEREVGIDWSKGRRARKTYDLMQQVLDGSRDVL